MTNKEILAKYGLGHIGEKQAIFRARSLGFSKQDPTFEETVAFIASHKRQRTCKKDNGEDQLEMFAKMPKEERIGKYKKGLTNLTFSVPEEARTVLVSNCNDFHINYGEVMKKIFMDAKWTTWNNAEWLQNFTKGGEHA